MEGGYFNGGGKFNGGLKQPNFNKGGLKLYKIDKNVIRIYFPWVWKMSVSVSVLHLFPQKQL